MRYYTWNGTRLFRKVETAAMQAVDWNEDPHKVRILTGGKLVDPEPWEIQELIMHMRDLTVF